MPEFSGETLSNAIASLSLRADRQAVYLAWFGRLSHDEGETFLHIFNELALTQSVQPHTFRQIERFVGQSALHQVLEHFVELFELWAMAQASRNRALLRRVYPVLEDMNIAVIAWRSRQDLDYGRRVNRDLKAAKRDVIRTSAN